MFYLISNILIFIITFSTLIVIHEFGHFIAAKIFKIPVKKFSIGLGKRILSWTDNQNTKYQISMLPLGGYVQLLNDFNIKKTRKTLFKYILVVLAGPISNFIFAFLIYFFLFFFGIYSNTNTIVNQVIPYSIADNQNFIPGTKIKEINFKKVKNWDDITYILQKEIQDNKNLIILGEKERNLKKIEIPTRYIKTSESNKYKSILSLGIVPLNVKIYNKISDIKQDSIAMKNGLRIGDIIISINDNNINSWNDVIKKSYKQECVKIKVKRNSEIININMLLKENPIYDGINFLGAEPVIKNIVNLEIENNKEILSYFKLSLKKTYETIKLISTNIKDVIIGNSNIDNISGPISIAKGAVNSYKHGITYYLMFLAFISINLGIVNLLPIPMLDGSQFVYLTLEMITGYPISKKIRYIFQGLGFLFLVILIGIALINDLYKI